MYRLLRTGGIKAGKNVEAMQAAQKIAEHINKNYSQTKLQVATQVFGDLGKICWFGDFESLAAIEEMTQKLQADEAFMGFVAKLSNFMIDGSGKDELYNIP